MRSNRGTLLRNEGGQTLIVVAISMIGLFGFTALTVDVGRLYFERRQLQRTADLSATSAAEVLASHSVATTVANQYASDNATQFRNGNFSTSSCDYLYINALDDSSPPAYSPPGSPCPAPVAGTNPCKIDLVQYYCVHTQVASTNFKLLFAPALGYGSGRTVSARATAVVGAAAPTSERLVPWTILDCPYPYRYPDESGAPPPTGCTNDGTVTTPGTGYAVSTTFNQYPTTLFLGSSGGQASGNFLGGDLDTTNCRQPDQGTNGGGNAYVAVLSGATRACPLAKGARVVPQTGNQGANTISALTTRGVPTWDGGSPCTTAVAFNKTVAPVGGDQVVILDRTNPCLMGVVFVVEPNLADSRMSQQNWDFHGKTCSYTGQTAVTTDAMTCIGLVQEPVPATRFSQLGGVNHGASSYLLVRRFGLFYLTHMATSPAACQVAATCGYTGVFLRAVDSVEGTLDGPADPRDQIQITKLVQ
ncbi:MAG: Tad domain-containing protein [Actinomycetota bacterium]|nr:Tad domain-containing protein [Actinomycetota bacterium]